jgi:hypothetical protein
MKPLIALLWAIGVACLFAACFPSPYWPYLLGLSVLLTGASAITAMTAKP